MLKITAALLALCTCVLAQVPTLDQVNAAWDEQAPVLTPDGKQLYFTIASHAQNIGGLRDHGDIWYSTRTESGWSAPIHAGNVLNNTLHNIVAGFSTDGRQIYLMSHYSDDGHPVTTQGIAVSTRTQEGWSRPQNINIPYFKNRSAYQSGYISLDAEILVFSADSYGSKGAEDIYMSKSVNGKWSEPINLGFVINTDDQDVCPSLSADKRRLYFASNGHRGLGSFDIFYADRLDDTWRNWSRPVNLGSEINSEGRELFYREFGDIAYMTTTQNSDGYADIRSRNRPIQTPQVAAVVVTPPVVKKDSAITSEVAYTKNDSLAKALTIISGKVTNTNTSASVPGASVQFHAGDMMVDVVADADGNFKANLPALHEYHVKIEGKGYIGRFEKLDLRTYVMKDMTMNFTLQPIEIGTTVNLKSVLFVQSKPVLLEESYDELDMVVDFMKLNPTVTIELSGHTDNRGRHDLNMKLSRERVDAVKAYLVSRGIDGRRVTGKGYGGTRPIADNEAEETRAINRRVEFTIVKE